MPYRTSPDELVVEGAPPGGAEPLILAALVDRIEDAVIATAPDGTVLVWNAAAAELTGQPAAAATGRRLADLVADAADPPLAELVEAAARGRSAAITGTWRHRDGGGTEVAITVAPVPGPDGHPHAALVLARPAGHQRRAEAAFPGVVASAPDAVALVEAGDRLRELDRMKSDFLSTVSHELRTPLTSIKGYAQTLTAKWDRLEDGVRHELVGRITAASLKLDRLIAELLDFTRLERGQLAIALHAHPVAALVTSVLDRLPEVAQDHEVDVDVPGDLAVLANEHAFARALENLLTNAAKFSDPGSPITVRARAAGDGEVAVEVSDRGIGMGADELDRIFDRFYRVADPLRGAPGTGIGLAIVKEYVEAQGGRVDVRSTPGGGSTFRITLRAPS